MVFRPRQRRQTLELSIQIDNNNMDCVKETVFLGVILDEHLSWKPHILSVSRKISKSIGIIYKSSFCLPKTSLHCLYYSLVYPYLIYCVSVWGSTYQSNLKTLYRPAYIARVTGGFVVHETSIFSVEEFCHLQSLSIGSIHQYLSAFANLYV